MTVENYIVSKGWDYKPCGLENWSVRVCPICQDEGWHFGIHKKLGLWRCLHSECQASGNLYMLKVSLGDLQEPEQFSTLDKQEQSIVPSDNVEAYHRSLLSSQSSLNYLTLRGIASSTISHFKLGLAYDSQGYWLVIPYFKDGACIDLKFRSIPPSPKAFKKLPGPGNCLFNIDSLNGQSEAYVTEGELDAVSLWQLGYNNVVSVPLGCGSFRPEHWDALAGKKKLYILFDNDQAGQSGAKTLADRLDPARCYSITLPGVKDTNEFIRKGGTKDQIDYLISQSKPLGAPTAYNVSKALVELNNSLSRTGRVVDGPTFPWDNVTDLFGPMAPGETSVVLGSAGVGKTSYVMQILTHVANECKTPALFLCLEMPVARLAQLLVSQTTACDRQKVSASEIYQTSLTLSGIPLYLARRPASLQWQSVHDLLVGSIRRLGIKVWALDNIQFMCRSDSMVQTVGIASRNLRSIAEETNTHAIIVSQPRKAQAGHIPSMDDAAWSQSLGADADAMHSIYRRLVIDTEKTATRAGYTGASASYEEKTIVHAAKTRYGGGGGTVLWLHGPSGRFVHRSI